MPRGLTAVTTSALTLRATWAARSMHASWAFPSDWSDPAVDAVCEAVSGLGDVFAAGERLGRARAASGVALGEALADIDQLIVLVPSHAELLRRAVSLGWADRVVGPAAEICDPLTGLMSRGYLQARLGELYAQCAAEHTQVNDGYAMVVVRLELSERNLWQRMLPMILVGETLRIVFDAGETLARLGEPMAVALVRRGPSLDRRVQLAARMIASRTAADPDSRIATPRVWVERLPGNFTAAHELIDELGR